MFHIKASTSALSSSSSSSSSSLSSNLIERPLIPLIGHKSRCFHICTTICNNIMYIISSSEDGAAILWAPTVSKKSIYTFKHGSSTEVLRSCFLGDNSIDNNDKADNNNSTIDIICTCGADGKAIIWLKQSNTNTDITSQLTYIKLTEIDHNNEQIYACEKINKQYFIIAVSNYVSIYSIHTYICHSTWSFHLTSCQLALSSQNNTTSNIVCEITYETYNTNNSTHFGGARNPDNNIYVFDAKLCPHNSDSSIIAISTSDSMLHIIDLANIISHISQEDEEEGVRIMTGDDHMWGYKQGLQLGNSNSNSSEEEEDGEGSGSNSYVTSVSVYYIPNAQIYAVECLAYILCVPIIC